MVILKKLDPNYKEEEGEEEECEGGTCSVLRKEEAEETQ